MASSDQRARLFRVAQYLLGAGALAWVLGQTEWRRVGSLLGDVSIGTVAALVAVSAVGLLVALRMWHVLLNSVEETRFRDAAAASLIVLFVNHLLPSRLSGRAVAPFVVHERTGMSYSDATAVSGVHTGLYAVLYGVTALLGLALGGSRLPVGLAFVLLLSAALYVAAGALMLLAGFHLRAIEDVVGRTGRVVRYLPVSGDRLSAVAEKIPSFTDAATATFRELLRDVPALSFYVTGFAISVLVVPGLRVWLLFGAFGTEFDPAVLLPVYLVMAYSVTLLPLTPGGIGVTEATATAVFVALGVPSQVVVPVVFADRFLGTYLPAVVGWYPFLQVDLSEFLSQSSRSD